MDREDRAKIRFADAVSNSEGTISIKELAIILTQNGFPIGQNKLFELLREEGYLTKGNKRRRNKPTQKSIKLGLFKLREYHISSGEKEWFKTTTEVTGKGQMYFVNRYCNSDEESTE